MMVTFRHRSSPSICRRRWRRSATTYPTPRTPRSPKCDRSLRMRAAFRSNCAASTLDDTVRTPPASSSLRNRRYSDNRLVVCSETCSAMTPRPARRRRPLSPQLPERVYVTILACGACQPVTDAFSPRRSGRRRTSGGGGSRPPPCFSSPSGRAPPPSRSATYRRPWPPSTPIPASSTASRWWCGPRRRGTCGTCSSATGNGASARSMSPRRSPTSATSWRSRARSGTWAVSSRTTPAWPTTASPPCPRGCSASRGRRPGSCDS